MSSAQLLPYSSVHPPTRPRPLLSRRPPQRLAGVMALFALRCLSKIQAPIIQKLTPGPNVIRCLPMPLLPPRFLRVHRLIALVGAVARAWRGWFACKGTCKKRSCTRPDSRGNSAQLRMRLYVALVVYHRLIPLSSHSRRGDCNCTVPAAALPQSPLCFTAILAQGMPRQALAVIIVSCTASCIRTASLRTHMGLLIIHKPAPQKKRACSPRIRLYGTGTGPAHGQRKAW